MLRLAQPYLRSIGHSPSQQQSLQMSIVCDAYFVMIVSGLELDLTAVRTHDTDKESNNDMSDEFVHLSG